MASKAAAATVVLLLLTINLVFFTSMVRSTKTCPPPPTTPSKKCPKDALKLGVCANVLGDLVHLVVGTPAKTPCCKLIAGLADLEAAVCLCTAIKAKVLGIDLNVPLSLSLLLNYCGMDLPSGFSCA